MLVRDGSDSDTENADLVDGAVINEMAHSHRLKCSTTVTQQPRSLFLAAHIVCSRISIFPLKHSKRRYIPFISVIRGPILFMHFAVFKSLL